MGTDFSDHFLRAWSSWRACSEYWDFWKLTSKFESVIVSTAGVLLLIWSAADYVILFETDDIDFVVFGAVPFCLVAAICALLPRPNIHTLAVERIQISSHVQNVESCLSLGGPIEHFEIEPVSVAFRIRVYFAEQIILILIRQVDRVQIPRLKVTVKLKKFLLVYLNGQISLNILGQVAI